MLCPLMSSAKKITKSPSHQGVPAVAVAHRGHGAMGPCLQLLVGVALDGLGVLQPAALHFFGKLWLDHVRKTSTKDIIVPKNDDSI